MHVSTLWPWVREPERVVNSVRIKLAKFANIPRTDYSYSDVVMTNLFSSAY